MNDEEIQEIIEELASLQIRQASLIERLEDIRERNNRDQEEQDLPEGLVADVGDTVRFAATRTTSGGVGVVTGFTRGWNPFARIRRTQGNHIGEEIKRKTSNLVVLRRPNPNRN